MDHEQTAQASAAQSQTVGNPTTHPERIQIPEHVQIPAPRSGESNGIARRDTSWASSTYHLNAVSEGNPTLPRSPENPYADFERVRVASPARGRDGQARVPFQRQTLVSNAGLPVANPVNSGIDWIVPVETKGDARRTVGERLQPTIDNAAIERDKYARKALWTGYALNTAIGLQVFLGALTTGLAAAVTGDKAQVSTAILGGLSTLVASYMARARGSGEPELSITRVKDLEQFLRECRAFQMDHAHEYSTPDNGLGDRLEDLRHRFEELLGNASGERKLSPVGITSTQAAP